MFYVAEIAALAAAAAVVRSCAVIFGVALVAQSAAIIYEIVHRVVDILSNWQHSVLYAELQAPPVFGLFFKFSFEDQQTTHFELDFKV